MKSCIGISNAIQFKKKKNTHNKWIKCALMPCLRCQFGCCYFLYWRNSCISNYYYYFWLILKWLLQLLHLLFIYMERDCWCVLLLSKAFKCVENRNFWQNFLNIVNWYHLKQWKKWNTKVCYIICRRSTEKYT